MSTSNYLVENVSEGHSDEIWCLCCTSAGVLTGSADATIKLWNPKKPDEATCTMSRKPDNSAKAMGIVSIDVEKSADGRPTFVLACSLDSSITRYSLREGSQGTEEASTGASSSKPGRNYSLAVHPDSSKQLFAVSGLGGQIRVLSSAVESFGEEKQVIQSRSAFVIVTYSPNGKLLASASSDGQVAIYDAASGSLVQWWTAHSGNIRAIAFSPDSSLVITGGDDHHINVFDVKALSNRENENADSSMRSRNSSAGQHVANLQGHTGWILSLSCRDDGRVFASSSSDGTIRLWDLARPASPCLATLKEHESDLWAVRWAPMPASISVEGLSGTGLGGGRLVSAGKDRQLKWWRGTG